MTEPNLVQPPAPSPAEDEESKIKTPGESKPDPTPPPASPPPAAPKPPVPGGLPTGNVPSVPKFSVSGLRIKETLLNFVVPLVSFALIALMGFFVIYPAITGNPMLQSEVDLAQQKKTGLEEKVAKLKKLVDFKSVVKENSELVDKVLVSESSAAMFLDEINQIAQSSGMEVERLFSSMSGSASAGNVPAPSAGTPVGDAAAAPAATYQEITASLGAKASYDQIILFMQELERAARILRVNDFRYSLGKDKDDEGGQGRVDFSIGGPYLFVSSTAVTDESIDFDISSQEFVNMINLIKGLKYYEFSNSIIPEPPPPKEEETPENPENPEGPENPVSDLPEEPAPEEPTPTPEE
jgi:Tfp pilus assembly protein PilO